MVLYIKASWSTEVQDKEERNEVYNFNRTDDFKRFVEETNDNEELKNCFEDSHESINYACNKWMSILNNLIKKSFKKIRVKKQKTDPGLEKLFEEKQVLKTYLATHDDNDEQVEEKTQKLDKVMDDIADICALKNKEIVEEYLGKNDDGLEGYNQAKIWALKKKLAPKNSEEPPMAKRIQRVI